jgi:hypothetical protein
MDEYRNDPQRSANPRRRKKTKLQIFKETYLPFVIIGVAVIFIVVCIIGSITRGVQKKRYEEQIALEASNALAQEKAQLALEEQQLLTEADSLAARYDYDAAIAILNTFSGNISEYPTINARKAQYERERSEMVAWDDPSKIVNLSFQMLVADLRMGLTHHSHAQSINRNFITTGEFSKILQELYDNGYILVTPDDYLNQTTSADGQTVYTPKTLYLPAGKKPLVLTQTNVNYNLYLIDTNGDKLADKGGGGFASKLLMDANGDITCEMVNSSGQTVTGDFDLVPIWDAFVEDNPDFSYRGSKAVLALTGYNGLFGYRTNPEAIDYFGQDAHDDAVQQAKAIAEKLRSTGYVLACYTYENIAYGDSSVTQVENDLARWNNEVVPILGQIDILVYAQNSDIASGKTYSGEKYNMLKSSGFSYFIGFCEENKTWFHADTGYARQGRILVTGSTLTYHSDWFMGMFYASNILDSGRGNVPA